MADVLDKQTNSGGLCSSARKHMTIKLAMAAVFDELEGDFVETGVFNGGTSILMAKVLQTHAAGADRCLWSCDSFRGLPEEDSSMAAMEITPARHVIGDVINNNQGQVGEYAIGRSV